MSFSLISASDGYWRVSYPAEEQSGGIGGEVLSCLTDDYVSADAALQAALDGEDLCGAN